MIVGQRVLDDRHPSTHGLLALRTTWRLFQRILLSGGTLESDYVLGDIPQDPFGNYVVQYVLGLQNPEVRRKLSVFSAVGLSHGM